MDAGHDEQREDGTPKRLLFRGKCVLFTVYRHNLPRATPDELRGLLERLSAFRRDVEARLVTAEARNHP